MLTLGKLRQYELEMEDVLSEIKLKSHFVTKEGPPGSIFNLDPDTDVYLIKPSYYTTNDCSEEDRISLVGKTSDGYYFVLDGMTCLRQGFYCRDCCRPYIDIKYTDSLDDFIKNILSHEIYNLLVKGRKIPLKY